MKHRIAATILLPLLWAAAVAGASAEEEDPARLAAELPPVKPLSPEEALRAFRIVPGFAIELVAAEPLVIDPVAMAFDEDGRLWVVEMRDYPFSSDPDNMTFSPEAAKQPPGRIRILEDTDGDGRADAARVFADGLRWPTGIALWKGGAFVTSAPDLLYLRDEDGDGAADLRRVVWTGFGTKNVQALLNNLKWGIDNWLYGAGGGNDGALVPGGGGEASPLPLRGRDFRFRPEGPLEVISGGGQFGLSFGLWGERFVCSNSNHLRHVVLQSRYLERNRNLGLGEYAADIAADGGAAPVFRASPPEPWRLVRTRWRAGSPDASRRYAPTELVPIGFFTSASGVTIYRGDAFPAEFLGNAFVGDVGGNLVHRKLLAPRGATFAARRPEGEQSLEFLTSTDNWFRPVNLAEGPDGALYILDMYRETIEHPYSIPDSIKAHLRLTNGNDRGRIWRIVPRGFRRPPPPRLSRAPSLDLVFHLERPNAWWRETAQRLLLERADPAVIDPLRAVARSDARSPFGRVHVLWTLEGLGKLRTEEIALALADPNPRVRENAVRLAEPRLRGVPSLLERVLALAADSDFRVRFQLALALGESEDRRAAAGLARLAVQDAGDRWARLAILSSASACAPDLLFELSRAEALLAGNVGPGGSAAPEGEAASAGGGAGPAKKGLRILARSLAEAIGFADRPGEVHRAIEVAVELAGKDLRRSVLLGLGEGLRRAGKELSGVLGPPGGLPAGTASKVQAVFEKAAALAAAKDTPPDERLEAIRFLAHAPFAVAREALPGLIDAREDRAVQLEAVRALSAHRGPAVAGLLLGSWSRSSPEVRRELLEALFVQEDRIPALLEAIGSGTIAPASIEAVSRKRLLDHRSPAVRERALALFRETDGGDRKIVLDSFRPALDLKGDLGRGREIFRKACATCHQLGGEGHAVGPDLRVAQGRTPEGLLTQILDPNRELLPIYNTYLVLTRDGRTITGLIASETAAGLTVKRAEGVEETVLRSSILKVEDTGLSLMPEGLEKELRAQDFADLIAYLLSIR